MRYFYFHVLPPGVGRDASETSGGVKWSVFTVHYFSFHVLPPGVGRDASETSGGGPSGGGDAFHQSRLPQHHGHHGEPCPTPAPPAAGWPSDVANWGVHAPHSTPGEHCVFVTCTRVVCTYQRYRAVLIRWLPW